MLQNINFKKLYLIFALVGIAILVIISYLSITVIANASTLDLRIKTFSLYNMLLIYLTPIFFVCLLVLSNIIYKKYSQSLYFVISNLIFIFFTLVNWLYISETFFHPGQAYGLMFGGLSIAGVIGMFFCIIAIFLSALNYLIIKFF